MEQKECLKKILSRASKGDSHQVAWFRDDPYSIGAAPAAEA